MFQMTAPMVKVMRLEIKLAPMDGCAAIDDDMGAAALTRVVRMVERMTMTRCDCLDF